MVLDFDKKHGGMETLTDWECRFGAMPRTPIVASGGGGRHFYFARPNVPLNPKPARGVDCLWGNGGGLISPPSLHECGGRYSWLVPLETPVAEMPTRLVEIIRLASAPQPKPTKAFAFNPMKGVVASGQTFADLGRFPPGSRYEPVKKTIGSMLGNGYTREQILEDGLAWADRQEPPYSADELREKVRWCASKQGVKITDLEYPQNEPLHKNEAVEPTAIRFSPFAPDAGEKDNPPHTLNLKEDGLAWKTESPYSITCYNASRAGRRSFPMEIVGKVAATIQNVLGPEAEELGRATGVIQRRRKFTAVSLLRMLVLTLLRKPDAKATDFQSTAAQLGLDVTSTAVENRFTPQLVGFLRAVLEAPCSGRWPRRLKPSTC